MTVPALVHEATRKSGVVWVAASAGAAARAVWHVWHDGADYVLHGGGEQDLPQLTGHAVVFVRSKHLGGTVVGWVADAAPVDPASAEWLTVEPLLRKARLHAEPDPTGRWRARSTLTRLRPTGALVPAAQDGPPGGPAPAPDPTLGDR